MEVQGGGVADAVCAVAPELAEAETDWLEGAPPVVSAAAVELGVADEGTCP